MQMLGDILPLAVATALGPLPLMAVVLMLSAPGGARRAAVFVVGRASALLLMLGTLTLLADLLPESRETTVAGGIVQILSGGGLIWLGVRKLRSRPRDGSAAKLPAWMDGIGSATLPKALRLGFLLTIVNPKELAFALGAGIAIGAAPVSPPAMVTVIIGFVLFACLSLLLPLGAKLFAARRFDAALAGLRSWLEANHPVILGAVVGIIGTVLIGQGLGYL